MNCNEIQVHLDAWVDGTLPAVERDAVDAHLASCDRCRAEAQALQVLVAEARALPREVLPARDLWDGIAGRMSVAARRPGDPPRRAPRWRLPAFRPLLAAAALGGLLLGVAATSLWQRQGARREFVLEQARYARASADLARVLAGNAAALAPETRAIVEHSLGILDQAITEAEAALAADPRNVELEQMLLARYEQRLNLLRRAAAVGGSVS